MPEISIDFTVVVLAIVIGLGGFLGVAIAVTMFMNPTRTAADRVRELTGQTDDTPEILVRPAAGRSSSSVTSVLAKLATSTDEEKLSAERLRMVHAGYRSPNALEIYNALRVGLTLALPVLLVLVLPGIKLLYLINLVMFAACLAYVGPSKWVDYKIAERKEALMKPFADALDLLVSSVEAGLGLDAAFIRVADEIQYAAPVLAFELQGVNREVAAGIPRTEALRRLDTRTGLSEINSLVNVLVQAERFGTSVASALRTHANLVRTRRMQTAEEKAAQISPKMTVAMILFLLPSLFVVILGPSVVKVIKILLPTLGVVI